MKIESKANGRRVEKVWGRGRRREKAVGILLQRYYAGGSVGDSMRALKSAAGG